MDVQTAEGSLNTATERLGLVVRVLAGRNISSSDAGKRVKVAVKLALGDSVKRSTFVGVSNGRARWDQEFVFPAFGSSSPLLEVSVIRNASSLSRGRSSLAKSTYINAPLFADIGSETHSGWFTTRGSQEDIKLSIFWRSLGSEDPLPSDEQPKRNSQSLRKLLFNSFSGPGADSSSVNEIKETITPRDVIYAYDEDCVNATGASKTHLAVTILAGRGLRPVNLGGKSDPFVILAIRGTRKKTKPVKGTLNPVWSSGNSFQFGDVEDIDDEDDLQMVVKDWDPLGRYKDLGQVVLTVKQVALISQNHGPNEGQWFPLEPTIYMPDKLKSTDLGSILVQITYVPGSAKSIQSPQSSGSKVQSPGPASSPPSSQSKVPLSPVISSPATTVPGANITDAMSTASEKPKLFVRLVQARNLYASDFGGTSDPYAILTCKGETRKTSARSKTLTPVYDFEAIFGEKDYIQENDELIIRFLDQDSVISDIVDDELGSVRIPMWSLLMNESVSMESAMSEPRWYSLEPWNSKQKCSGEVQLALYYSNPAAKKPDIYKGKVWLFELQTTVLTARNLGSMSTEPHARIKPYCTVTCGRKDRWKTNVASNGVNPTWSERFRFRHTADSNSDREGISKTDALKIAVFNSVTSECLGKLSIDVSYIMDRLGYIDLQGKAFTAWFDLVPSSQGDEGGGFGGHHDDASDLDEEDLMDNAYDGSNRADSASLVDDSVNIGNSGISTIRNQAKRFSDVLKRRITGPASMKRSSSSASSTISAPAVLASASSPSEDAALRTPSGPSPPSGTKSINDRPLSPTNISQYQEDPSMNAAFNLDGSTNSIVASIPDEKAKRVPKGQIRLTLRLLPIGETRVKNVKKLGVYINEFNITSRNVGLPDSAATGSGSNVISQDRAKVSASLSAIPPLVYVRCRVGFDSRISPNVPFYSRIEGGKPRFHTLFCFDEEIDWLLDSATKRYALQEKTLRRFRHQAKGDMTRARLLALRYLPPAQDTIVFSIHDASNDRVLCETKTTFMDVLIGRKMLETADLSLPSAVDGDGFTANKPTSDHPILDGTLNVSMKLVDIKQEMIPLLGHIFIRLLSFKSLVPPRFDHGLRFVIRYGDRVFPSKMISGDPFPTLTDVHGSELLRFPVFNVFKNITIEVWQARVVSPSPDAAESNQALALAKSVLSVFKRTDSAPDGTSTEQSSGNPLSAMNSGSSSSSRESVSKWGSLIGTSSLTLFDLIEIEAQTVFEEDQLTLGAREKAFKLRVQDRNGRDQGSLWIQGRYAENFGGVLSPNPNPHVQEGKPFSLANFRHEINRLVKVVGWLSSFGAHVGGLLNWESSPKTVSTIVAITVVCSVDWFSSRWLIIFPFCMLIHMINRHRLRSNGMFVSEFEETDGGEEGMSAEVRLACISAKPADTVAVASSSRKSWKKVHAQVSLIPRPGKQHKVIGQTRVDPRIENNEVDFVSSKVGYAVRGSVKARPSVQMWKFSETLPAVPSFSFRVENFTVLKETILVVTLFSARNLISADSNGFSDPFARIFVKDAMTGQAAGDVYKSTVRFKTLNPVWNEKFVLGEKKAVVASSILVLNFFDSDVIATSNDPLGNVEIDLSQLALLFPASGLAHLPQEQRATLAKRWFNLAPPKGANRRYFKGRDASSSAGGGSPSGANAEYGEVCLHVEWMHIANLHEKKPVAVAQNEGLVVANGLANHNGDAADGESMDEEEDTAIDSWTQCGAQIAVDLFDQKEMFLGRAVVPIGAIVKTDEERVQPQVEIDLPLLRKFDGSKDDIRLGEIFGDNYDANATYAAAGSVRLRAMITLPDPKAKERRMAMLEAKRADRASVFQKMRMITKHLERVQTQLAAVNSRAERFKNLFNWAHPRRTKLMFNLMLFLMALFILIPSRFFILMVVLFFFTEKFRPMGTMGARFKHLLSLLPTDDDLRNVVQGNAATGKRKIISGEKLRQRSSTYLRRSASSGGDTVVNQLTRRSTAASDGGHRASTPGLDQSQPLSKKALAIKLQNICAGDALFSGSLSFAKVSKKFTVGEDIKPKHLDFSRKFFIVSNIGLHYWSDREAIETSHAIGHILSIVKVMDSNLPEVRGFERQDCLFLVETEEEKLLFLASSEPKRMAWVRAIRAAIL